MAAWFWCREVVFAVGTLLLLVMVGLFRTLGSSRLQDIARCQEQRSLELLAEGNHSAFRVEQG